MIYILLLLQSLWVVEGYQYICNQSDWKQQPRVYLNSREVLASTAHNFSIIVDASDSMVSERILVRGSWQPQIMFLISKLVQQGDTVLNLGAQTGLQAVLMGKMAGRGKMFVMEPFSVSYRILMKNIFINELSDITTCYRLAAGDRQGKVQLQIDTENTGHSRIFRGSTDGLLQIETVGIERVDSVLPHSTRLDFALIDVQMQEVSALLGMRQILSQSLGLVAIIEWSQVEGSEAKQQASQLLQWLQRLKFEWVRYKEGGQCTMGNFQRVQWRQLLSIKTQDLLLAGPQAKILQQINLTL